MRFTKLPNICKVDMFIIQPSEFMKSEKPYDSTSVTDAEQLFRGAGLYYDLKKHK